MTRRREGDGLDGRPDIPEYSRFVDLVAADRFSEGEELATTALREQPSEWRFWKTQLVYVCFLNDKDNAAQFERSPLHLGELVARYPNDHNGHFWKAYVDLILLDAREAARNELYALSRVAPYHAYVSLVLGGMPEEASKAVGHLEASLRIVPNNFRAMRDLGYVLNRQDRRGEARLVFEALLLAHPFVETSYGVMNPYMNEVLTGAGHAAAWKAEARHYIAQKY